MLDLGFRGEPSSSSDSESSSGSLPPSPPLVLLRAPPLQPIKSSDALPSELRLPMSVASKLKLRPTLLGPDPGPVAEPNSWGARALEDDDDDDEDTETAFLALSLEWDFPL